MNDKCPHCGSTDINELVELDYSNLYWCWVCGTYWWEGRNKFTHHTPTWSENRPQSEEPIQDFK